MKTGCSNGTFRVNDSVYFVVVVDETPHTVKYNVIEKIENIDGYSYVIEVAQDQDDPRIVALVEQQKVGTNFRICGDSIFSTREGARAKARDYFQKLVDQLS